MTHELERVLDLLVLGKQPPEDLPMIAAHALADGFDSPALREVAGLPRQEYQDARDLFLEAAQELDLIVPTEQTARWRLVRRWAEEIVDGQLPPDRGARRIWWEGWNELGRPESLTAFVVLADDWEELPERRPEIESKILVEARKLVAGH